MTWRKSSYSGGNGSVCVEVAALGADTRVILVRDTKDGAITPLQFTVGAWRRFAAALR